MTDLEAYLEFPIFPPIHTCSGENGSPKITITGLDCTSLVIIVDNPSIRNSFPFSSWVIGNLPARQIIPSGIPHGKIVTSPVNAMLATNDAGEIGYTGPCPPHGQTHRYSFKIYGLDCQLTLTRDQPKTRW